jgi:hypothetical protein
VPDKKRRTWEYERRKKNGKKGIVGGNAKQIVNKAVRQTSADSYCQ